MRMQATISAAAVGFSLILAPEAIAWVQQETDSAAASVPQARTETQASNGDVLIQVIDGERMVRISQREAGITVTVVETQRGVDKTERYFARTLEQLRKKEPRAYELFQALSRRRRRVAGDRCSARQHRRQRRTGASASPD